MISNEYIVQTSHVLSLWTFLNCSRLYINISSMFTVWWGHPPQKKSWKSWEDHWSLDKRAKIYAEPQWQQLNDNFHETARNFATKRPLQSPESLSKYAPTISVLPTWKKLDTNRKDQNEIDRLITENQTTSSCSCQFLPETSTEIPKRSSSSYLFTAWFSWIPNVCMWAKQCAYTNRNMFSAARKFAVLSWTIWCIDFGATTPSRSIPWKRGSTLQVVSFENKLHDLCQSSRCRCMQHHPTSKEQFKEIHRNSRKSNQMLFSSCWLGKSLNSKCFHNGLLQNPGTFTFTPSSQKAPTTAVSPDLRQRDNSTKFTEKSIIFPSFLYDVYDACDLLSSWKETKKTLITKRNKTNQGQSKNTATGQIRVTRVWKNSDLYVSTAILRAKIALCS